MDSIRIVVMMLMNTTDIYIYINIYIYIYTVQHCLLISYRTMFHQVKTREPITKVHNRLRRHRRRGARGGGRGSRLRWGSG